jgi:trehalose 6-phosphate phosphatase
MAAQFTLPEWNTHWALFLDVDGTLLEIVGRPEEVEAAPRLKRLLAAAHRGLEGALALVSGRSIASLDLIFAPLCLPAAGLHGIERRGADGRVHYPSGFPDRLAEARRLLVNLVQSHPGLLLEDKGAALALHFRNAPELAGECHRHMETARAAAGAEFHVQPGKMVLELKPSGHDKGTAIASFMAEVPFRGRQPVFIGDDITDEDGFRVVNELGGLSIRVGAAAHTSARLFTASVTQLVGWLEHATEQADVPAA